VNKTVSSVIDDINEWKNPHREGEFVYYVTAFFTDGEVGSAGRKDMDAALEVQGLLQEAIGQELDFTLEPKAPTKSGKPAWKILGFGTPGGAATYTAPGVQGDGNAPTVTATRVLNKGSRPPEQIDDIRRAVALKAAVEYVARWADNSDYTDVLTHAERFEAWLAKTSDASSAYPSTDSPSVTPAGASEDSSGGSDRGGTPPTIQTPLAGPELAPGSRGGGVESKGKEPAPPSHIHDWQPTGLHGKLKCEGCGEMRDREAVK
jgi:hypothetical protein